MRTNVAKALDNTREQHPPRSFTEHLQSLLGGSTWREPMLGATPTAGRMPAAHEVAAALGMVRGHLCVACGAQAGSRRQGACTGCGAVTMTKPDPTDIGPLAAEDLLFGQTRHAGQVCRAVADALAADRNSRACQRCRPWLLVVCWAAYYELAHGHGLAQIRPSEVTADDWDLLTEVARRVIGALAEDAVHRARAKWRAR